MDLEFLVLLPIIVLIFATVTVPLLSQSNELAINAINSAPANTILYPSIIQILLGLLALLVGFMIVLKAIKSIHSPPPTQYYA